MNRTTEVDRSAPVLAHHEIEIAAPRARVWRLHTAVNDWPKWQREITAAAMTTDFEPGSSFDWTSYGFPVTSTIYSVDDGTRVLWGGTAGGITGIHEWVFDDTPNGVRVRTTESFAGEPVEAAIESMQSMLDQSLVSWLAHLKAAAEEQAGSAD